MDAKYLRKICLIIDLDGFHFGIDKKFHAREMGYASLTKNYVKSFRFNLKHLFKTLTENDIKTTSYCKFKIHGLAFRPIPDEKDTIPENELKDIIIKLYTNHKTFDQNIIAYKGGRLEKDILDELKIPSLNLEDYDCPKYEDLPTPAIKDCGFHIKMEKVHCPLVECTAFYEWVKKRILEG